MTFMILFTIGSFIAIVGGLLLLGKNDTARRGEQFQVTTGNYLGCSLILWALVMFWAWLIFGVLVVT